MGRFGIFVIVGGILGAAIWAFGPAEEKGAVSAGRPPGSRPVPVEVGLVSREAIELRRTYSGTLAPSESFVAAPKVSGRVVRLAVDLSDPVTPGQVVAELDNEEFLQSVAQAKANLAVAEAERAEAKSALAIAERSLARLVELRRNGVASEAEVDVSRANLNAREAGLEVARAEIQRANSVLEAARIRLGYTRVTAAWPLDAGTRVVAQRSVDVGDTVSSNDPLFTIVDLDPLKAVLFVTDRDYPRLAVGQRAQLTTDLFPEETFEGTVRRIAPVFRAESRQARVELDVPNPDSRLRPGTFTRVTVVLGRAEDATVVPLTAWTEVAGVGGVYLVAADGVARFHAAEKGIRDTDRLQLLGVDLPPGSRVVTLGQPLLTDGIAVTIPESASR